MTVTVYTKTFAPAVQLVSPSGEELARDDHGGFRRSYEAQVVARLPADGRYLVRVATNGGRASGGVYVVAVRSGTVRSMALNTRADGRYEDPWGADVWSFDAVAGQMVSVGVYSDGVWPDAFSPVVQIRSPGGRPVARDEDILRFSGADREARLVAFLPDDGRYFVEITDARAFRTGTYRMTVHAPAVTPLELNAPASGVLSYDGPAADVWSFAGAAGQTVGIEMIPDDFWPEFRLFSPTGSFVFAGSTRGVVTLPVTGRYLLAVTVGGLPAGLGGSGAYEVAVRAQAAGAADVRGPGATAVDSAGERLRRGARAAVDVFEGVAPAAAMPLELDGPAVRVAGDVELWSFEGAAGQVVRFTASDRILDVVAPDGERVAQNDNVVTARLPMDGRYLVRPIGTLGGASAGDYEVAVRSDQETTDTLPLLAMNMPGGAGGGTFREDGPRVGVWVFEGTAGQTISVEARADLFDPIVQVLLPTGEQLASAAAPAGDESGGFSRMLQRFVGARADDSSLTSVVRLDAFLPVTGRYLVRVVPASYLWTEMQTGDYEVEVRPTSATSSPR